jgi:Putative peptidoglycan binding domain
MSEGPAIALGVVVVAIVAALAAGGGSSREAASSASDTPVAAGTRSTGPCTGLDTVPTGDGRTYVQYPVSSSNSLGCTLASGDRGEQVAALQRALALCMDRSLPVDGVYGAKTSAAVKALGGEGGDYGPAVARIMRWPSFSTSTRAFTGRCSAGTTSA